MPEVSPEHLAARRQQILDAARVCFARNGFHPTTIEDIRTEAGVSAGSIYRYFASKDDVVLAFLEEGDRIVDAQLGAAARPDENALAVLERILDDFFEAFGGKDAREGARLSVQFWAEAARSPVVHRVEARRLRRMARTLATTVALAQQQGSVRGDLAALSIAHLLIGGVQAMILRAALVPARERRAFRETLRVALLEGVLVPQATRTNT